MTTHASPHEPGLQLVRVGRHRPTGTPRLRAHVHADYHELVVVLSGDYRVVKEDGCVEGQPGFVFYHPRGVTHAPVSPGERPVDLLYVAWRQKDSPAAKWPRIVPDRLGRMRMLVLWMWTCFASRRPEDRGLVHHLLPALLHEYEEQARPEAGDLLTRLQVFVQANYRRPLRLADLAKAVGMSPFHFAHVLKRQVGVTPMQYLRQARVEAAREQLLHSGLSLKTIARLTGFANPYHLSRVFKQVTGVPPSRLRRTPI